MSVILIFRWLLNVFELLACVAGLLTWGRVNGSYLQKFAYFLLVVLLVELTGKYLSFNTALQPYNPMLYRYFGTPVQFLFIYWLYYIDLRATVPKYILIVIPLCYLVAWVFDEVFKIKTDWKWFSSFSFGVGVCGILILLAIYFLNFMKGDKIVFFYDQPMFWISFGLLFGYILTIPLFILRNNINKEQQSTLLVYWETGVILNCLMYLLFAISFICTKKKS